MLAVTVVRMQAHHLELIAVYQLSCAALISFAFSGVCLVACPQVSLGRIDRQVGLSWVPGPGCRRWGGGGGG